MTVKKHVSEKIHFLVIQSRLPCEQETSIFVANWGNSSPCHVLARLPFPALGLLSTWKTNTINLGYFRSALLQPCQFFSTFCFLLLVGKRSTLKTRYEG